MFHWDGGLVLTKARLAVDFQRRRPRAFISHAHTDHMARHEYALCTPATSALYQQRLGRRPTRIMEYGSAIEWGGLRLTAFPAGHCLGSAMLFAEDGDDSLLYTGDFKLTDSATAEPAELPRAETLIMETTYGDPAYAFPSRAMIAEQLCYLVQEALDSGATPIVEAYALGKAQEVTRILANAGFAVLQHPLIQPISAIYESFGVALGCRGIIPDRIESGHVLVVPPGIGRSRDWPRPVRIAVTGWAIRPETKFRRGVNHALPLSDHADYGELIEAIHRVAPRRIYCTHGPESFVDRLREMGLDAHRLGPQSRGL
jgi:Cft2 family RNA processing exonuclease